MEYEYLPNTYDYNLIEEKNIKDDFYNLQISYRKKLEQLLKKYVSFTSFDDLCQKMPFLIPKLNFSKDDFYHTNTTLDSEYLYIRNNIHIERLDKKDISKVKSFIFDNKNDEEEFILRTLKDVIFEDGDEVFYGIPKGNNSVSAKALVIEFAYDDKQCSLKDGAEIKKLHARISASLKKFLESILNVEVVLMLNNDFQ